MEKVRPAQAFGNDLGQLGFEAIQDRRGQHREPKVLADADTDGAVRWLASQGDKADRWLYPKLGREVDKGASWNLLGIVQEAAGAPQAAQVQGGPQPVVRAAGTIGFLEIGRGQRPVIEDQVGIGLFLADGGRLSHRG